MEANLAGIERVRELLGRLEQARARLEEVDGDEAVDVLRDLAELAKEVQAEIDRARRDEPESMPYAGG